MALIDIIDYWHGTHSGDFQYENGETVNFTHSHSQVTPNHTNDEMAAFNPHYNPLQTATVTFDQQVQGMTLEVKSWDTNIHAEIATVSVDLDDGNGLQVIDLNQWLSDGKISVSGPLVDAGGDLFNADGNLGGWSAHGDTTNFIHFNVSVSAVAVQRINPHVGTPTSGTALLDILIEDTANVVPCFTAGTLIDTNRGPIRVEGLQVGDMIRTKDHGFQPVKWIGASRVYASGFDVPLRIKAGTFGNSRDLVVSKRHKMLMDHTHLSLMFDVEEAFACAMHLRNDDTIMREPEGWVTYYHVLLPQHEVIYAEGAATESFYPDEGTLAGMAKGAKEELLNNFTPETYGPPARLTFDPMRAMWIGRNLDILRGDNMGQIAAYENAMKAAE